MGPATELEPPGIGRTARLVARAFLLRCPHCGNGPVLEHWRQLRVKCGTCGLCLQRGERDSFTGPMCILFTLVVLIGYALIVAALLLTRTPPWDLLQYGLPALAVVLLQVLFPSSKLLWLAFDLMRRPVTPQDVEWHQAVGAEFETERDAPG